MNKPLLQNEQNNRIEIPTFDRAAPLVPSSIDLERRTVEVVFTTGARVRRYDWWNDRAYDEELEVSESAVDLTRLNNGAPLLDSHQGFGLSSQIGVVERAWLKAGEGRAVVRFSDREDVAGIWRDVQNAIVRNVSVGYSVRRYEVAKVEGNPDLFRAVEWQPFEISMVPIPADAGAGTRAQRRAAVTLHPCVLVAAAGANFRSNISLKGEAMNTQNAAPSSISPGGGSPHDMVAAERHRTIQIIQRVECAGLPPEVGTTLIERGVSLDHVGNEIIDEMARRGTGRPAMPIISGGTDFADPDVKRDRMAQALAARYSPLVKMTDEAREYASYRISDIASELLAMRGERVKHQPGWQLIERVLTTSDFPLLLANVGTKTLLAAYLAAPAGILSIGRRTTAVDFKTKHQLRLGEAPLPEKIGESGEIQYGAMAESDETYRVEEFGKIIKLSRQALVNDDLGAFSQLTTMFAEAAREVEAQTIVDLLTQTAGVGPTMSDGQPLFHSTHGNLAGAGAAIDVTTVGAGRAAMRSQKGLSGRPVNIVPKYLVTNAVKETLGEQVLSTIYAAKVSDANPFSERLTLVVDPRLDAKSATAWYMAADQNQAAIEYAHLEGEEGPSVQLKEGWTTSGVEVRCYMTFGAGAVDFRGIYRNPGA